MVMMFKKDSISDDYEFDYRRLNKDAIDFSNVLDVLEKRNNNENEILLPRIHRDEYLDKSLIFNNPVIENILQNIEKLDNFVLTKDEVAQGIVPPQDLLNKKNQKIMGGDYVIGDGVFVLSDIELQSLNPTEQEKLIIKPYFTSKELHPYFGNKNNQFWIIYTTSDFKNPEKINPFPNIKNHLDQFVKIITSSNKPYGLHRARDESFFKGEKIVSLRKCSNRPIFTYTDFDCYVSATFYVIKTKRINQTLLTGFLNSSVCTFWLRYKGKMQGNNYQIDKEPLINIPIPIMSEQFEELIIRLVNQIFNSKESTPNRDTLALEQEIDKLFYKLYDLTDEEIAIVEKSI
jgi:adenine-specific DNA-methyltransferase